MSDHLIFRYLTRRWHQPGDNRRCASCSDNRSCAPQNATSPNGDHVHFWTIPLSLVHVSWWARHHTSSHPVTWSVHLSFSLPMVLTSPPSWLKNVRDDLFIPPNGCHHLRGLFPKDIIIPKQIYRTSFSEIPLFTKDKSCFSFSSTFPCKSNLTLLYAGIQNSWTNSLQL